MCLPIRIKTLCLRVKQGIASGSLSRGDLVLFKLLLTALSFFRATSPEWSEVKKSTITDPFSGTCETLSTKSIEAALRSMGWKRNNDVKSLSEVFNPLVDDFKSAIKSLEKSGLPVIPALYCIPFVYFILKGDNPVGLKVWSRLKSFIRFCRKGDSLFYSKPTIFQFSQKAGPNANLAILGIGIDLLG
jgi:hypothetical protein